MREYIRHPFDIPIEYSLEDVIHVKKEYLHNISQGGLCFRSKSRIKEGSVIQIKIPINKPVFTAKGIVVWCQKTNSHFDIGIKFSDNTTEFNVRMIEQVCHIEHYKKRILKHEGRILTGEEAAIEWITKYAKNFPS